MHEDRFRLLTDDGRSLLLTVSHRTRAPLPTLDRYLESDAKVAVEYEGEPGLDSGVARHVEPASEGSTFFLHGAA